MTNLVTGVAGFIGSRVAQMLLERGETVVGIDTINDCYSRNLKKHRIQSLQHWSAFKFHRIDVESYADILGLFGAYSFRVVFNLAARAGVRSSIEDPWTYMRTNTEGTLNLLEAMRRKSVRKLVLASTSSLYAGFPTPFREDLPVNTPLSPYAVSKKAAETMAYSFHRQYGLDISVLRYFTVFGPAGRPDMAPYRFIESVLNSAPVVIYGDGLQTRDFTYVDDIARGTILASKDLGYEIVNLGGGNEPVPLLEFVGWIEEFVGRRARLEFQPFHPADMDTTRADIAKAERLLDWRPEVDPKEGVRRTVAWHKEIGSRLRISAAASGEKRPRTKVAGPVAFAHPVLAA